MRLLTMKNYIAPFKGLYSGPLPSSSWRCLLGLAPAYLVEFCGPIQSARSSRFLRSADQGLLRVPFARTSARQKRAFAVVGPSIWNGLPLSIRSLPRTFSQTFLSQLKAVLFGRVRVGSASE